MAVDRSMGGSWCDLDAMAAIGGAEIIDGAGVVLDGIMYARVSGGSFVLIISRPPAAAAEAAWRARLRFRDLLHKQNTAMASTDSKAIVATAPAAPMAAADMLWCRGGGLSLWAANHDSLGDSAVLLENVTALFVDDASSESYEGVVVDPGVLKATS
jgi:hypothetical protein